MAGKQARSHPRNPPSFLGRIGLVVSEDIEIFLREKKVALCHELDLNEHLWATNDGREP